MAERRNSLGVMPVSLLKTFEKTESDLKAQTVSKFFNEDVGSRVRKPFHRLFHPEVIYVTAEGDAGEHIHSTRHIGAV